MSYTGSKFALLLLCGWLSACATNSSTTLEDVPEIRPGILQGYLASEAYPNSLTLLPPPPTTGSVAHQHDLAVSELSLRLHNTPRWSMATQDNDLSFPAAAQTFSCALGFAVTESDTPRLYRLMRRTLPDAGLSTYGAKRKYQRQRPFMHNSKPTCLSPEGQQQLVEDGSYPSGHSAIGWAWALILAELAPDRADEILARGRAFGQSRVVCNVHWQSDVQEGQMMGAAAVAALHANPTFLADSAAARAELLAVREQLPRPTRDCAAEGLTLSAQIEGIWPMPR